jgi:hypothetical protein
MIDQVIILDDMTGVSITGFCSILTQYSLRLDLIFRLIDLVLPES